MSWNGEFNFTRHAGAAAAVALGMLSGLGLAQPESAATHIQRAHERIAEGKTEAAIAEYEAAVTADPANAEAQGNLGVLEFFANHCAKALPHLKTALGLNPSEARMQALVGICQKRQGDVEEAERNLTAALPSVTNPKVHGLILINLTDIEYARGDLEHAGARVSELLKEEPDNPDALYLAFRIDTDLADAARDKLTIVAPDSARTHLMMAQEFIKAGDASSAIHQYKLAQAQEPSLPGIHFELGEAMLKESLGEESLTNAAAELQLALKEDPRNAAAESKLGVIEGFRGHAEAAEAHYRSALALKPDQVDALLGLGGILRERGENAPAAELFARASVADPLDETIHFRLAQIYRELSRKADADREMKLYSEIRELKSKSSLAQARRTAP